MFGIGMNELLLVLALALIVIGPKKLPDIAKALGRGLAEFKRATEEFKNTIAEESRVADPQDQLQQEGKIRAPGVEAVSPEEAASPAAEQTDAPEGAAGNPASEEGKAPAGTEARESSHDR